MKNAKYAALSGAAAAMICMPVLAQTSDFSSGRKVDNVETGRSVAPQDAPRAGGARSDMVRGAGETSRGIDAAGRSLRMIERARDGTQREVEPSQRVLDAVSGRDRAESDRAVFGSDDRRAVSDSTEYPYLPVGVVQATHPDPELVVNCVGTLVGPRLVLTAAHCVYDHGLEGGWIENVGFWPGINGGDKVPLGMFDWQHIYVFDGYIANYQGNYDSVWPYDLALIILSEPAGEQAGWLGYDSFEELGSFSTTLIGYRADRGDFTQWTASCDVAASYISDVDFLHACDADVGADAGPMYIHDAARDTYSVVGINMGDLDDANWALRLTEPMALWIDDMNRR